MRAGPIARGERRPRAAMAVAVLGVVLIAGVALAGGRVFINGVNVGAVRDLRLRNCTVDFDANGDIRIAAPDYTVQAPAAGRPEPEPVAPLSRKYWLTTEATPPGATQFELYLWINGKLARTIKSSESGLVIALNPLLVPGKNLIGIKAKKSIEGQRISRSPEDRFIVLVAEGQGAGDTLRLTDVLVRYQRTAADMSDYDDMFTVVAQ